MFNLVTSPKYIAGVQIYRAVTNELTNTYLDLSQTVSVTNSGASSMTGSEVGLSLFTKYVAYRDFRLSPRCK
jgi:hypothetical protein